MNNSNRFFSVFTFLFNRTANSGVRDRKAKIYAIMALVFLPCFQEAFPLEITKVSGELFNGDSVFDEQFHKEGLRVNGLIVDLDKNVGKDTPKFGGGLDSFVSFVTPYIKAVFGEDAEQTCDDSNKRGNCSDFHKWWPTYFVIIWWIFIYYLLYGKRKPNDPVQPPAQDEPE